MSSFFIFIFIFIFIIIITINRTKPASQKQAKKRTFCAPRSKRVRVQVQVRGDKKSKPDSDGLFEMKTRWKGKRAEAIALAYPMSKVLSQLQTSLTKFEACGFLSGPNVLALLGQAQTTLLRSADFGRPIHTTEKHKQWIQLSLEEAFYLCHSLKCLKIIASQSNYTMSDQGLWDYMKTLKPTFPYFYKAYSHLRKKNWVVKIGSEYGVDFVAYSHHPSLVHSAFAVIVSPVVDRGNKRLNVWSDYFCTTRLGATIAKTLLVLTVDQSKSDGVSPSCLENYTVEERTVTCWRLNQCREDRAIFATN